MGAVITKLRKRRKNKKEKKSKKKGKRVVVSKKGAPSPQSSRRRPKGSSAGRRTRSNNGTQRSQTRQRKPLTEVFTNHTYETPAEILPRDNKVKEQEEVEPAALGKRPNDSQRSKNNTARGQRRKSNGTQRSQKGHTVLQKRPLNDIFPKTEDQKIDGVVGRVINDDSSSVQQRGTKLRASQRSKKGSLRRRKSSRKLKKHLFPSPAVFSEIDAHVIRTGEQLKKQRIVSIKAITQAITVGAVTDLQKLRAIWIWICHNIEYDISGYLGFTEKITTPERVVQTGLGICCGYSRLCQEMCREVGVECREVSGHSKGASYRPGVNAQSTKSDHAWNAVQIRGHWYLLDACWGAGNTDLQKRVFTKSYNEFYFLTDPDKFISSHFPDDREWQLMKQPISLDEFQKMVQTKSMFYQLELTLHHPRQFLIVTENGDATISMTFPEPVDFMYKTHQRSGSVLQELDTSVGFLTITQTHMKLLLRPPTQGTFDITVYAKTANTPGEYTEVCNFLMDCPRASSLESFPDNPSQSWGLLQNAKDMGLKPCQYEAKIMLDSGSFEMVLPTTKPLMITCELFHKNLDKSQAKRCVATQSEPDQLSCHVLCPFVGYYRLAVFVKDRESNSKSYDQAGNFLLHCTGGTLTPINKLFPPELSHNCGPGNSTLKVGLRDFSHTRAVINSQKGQCNITFRNPNGLQLSAKLSREERQQPKYPISRYVLLSCDDHEVTVNVALPDAGVYRLSLFGGPAKQTSLSHICDYVLCSHWEGSWPPYPLSYSEWAEGGVLYEPRTGLLEPMSKVRFCVKIPMAKEVYVIGQGQTKLTRNQESQVWEGDVSTGTGPRLQLAASLPGNENGSLSILLCFDVSKTPNGMR